MKNILWLFTITGTLLMANSSKQDDKTGLIWQDNKEILDHSLNYDDAKQYCQNLDIDGFNDWRLPTLREYYTIVDLTQDRPALKNGFEIRDDGRYWTVTPFAKNPQKEAWYISMGYGEAEPYKKSRLYNVRCVRNSLNSMK